MMKLPDDMFRHELLPYLTVDDIVRLDNAYLNYEDRSQLLDKISGLILKGQCIKLSIKNDTYVGNSYPAQYMGQSMKASLFQWLGIRRIYLINMKIVASDFYLHPSIIENDYVDQFRYIQHVLMKGCIRADTAIFIVSHCPSLFSIIVEDEDDKHPDHTFTDHTLQSIAEHCNRLQILSLRERRAITDVGLISISKHCSNLKFLDVYGCDQITDASIISVSTHCTRLQSLNLGNCLQITDVSIISISTHCTALKSLNLKGQITDASIISISTQCPALISLSLWKCRRISDASIISISTHCTRLQSLYLGYCCRQITDASIISISTNCTRLQSLHLEGCRQITDTSIISISTHCTRLQRLKLLRCRQITDASIISISENCTRLRRLLASPSTITDASLIALAKNCTGLQKLITDHCNHCNNKRNFKKQLEAWILLSDVNKYCVVTAGVKFLQ